MAMGGELGNSQINASDALHDFSCTPCSKDGKNAEALFQCTDCQFFYCQRCMSGHNKFTRNHNVLEKSSKLFGQVQRQHKSAATSKLPTDVCQEHHGEIIKMFCGQHDIVCCTVCIAVKHRSCKDVEYIPNIAKRLLTGKAVDRNKTSLEKVKDELQNFKSKVQNELRELSEQREDILVYIQIWKKSVISRIDELEKKSIKQVKDKYKATTDDIYTSIKKINYMLKDVELQLDKHYHTKNDNEAQIFVNIKYGEKQILEANDCLKQSSARQKKTLVFEENENLRTCLNDIQYIGTVKDGPSTRKVEAGKFSNVNSYGYSRGGKDSNYSGDKDSGNSGTKNRCFSDDKDSAFNGGKDSGNIGDSGIGYSPNRYNSYGGSHDIRYRGSKNSGNGGDKKSDKGRGKNSGNGSDKAICNGESKVSRKYWSKKSGYGRERGNHVGWGKESSSGGGHGNGYGKIYSEGTNKFYNFGLGCMSDNSRSNGMGNNCDYGRSDGMGNNSDYGRSNGVGDNSDYGRSNDMGYNSDYGRSNGRGYGCGYDGSKGSGYGSDYDESEGNVYGGGYDGCEGSGYGGPYESKESDLMPLLRYLNENNITLGKKIVAENFQP